MTPNEFQTINAQNTERTLKIAKTFKDAAEKTYAVVARSEVKCRKVRNAIQTQNKDMMWHVLQEYIREYADFIMRSSELTGITLCKVDQEFYKQITTNDVENQLETVIGFVYAKEALSSVMKETYKKCVEKLLKERGLFTKKELSRLFV